MWVLLLIASNALPAAYLRSGASLVEHREVDGARSGGGPSLLTACRDDDQR